MIRHLRCWTQDCVTMSGRCCVFSILSSTYLVTKFTFILFDPRQPWININKLNALPCVGGIGGWFSPHSEGFSLGSPAFLPPQNPAPAWKPGKADAASWKKIPGGYSPKNGCATRFPKPLPYLWPKSAIFPTLFMTWPKFLYPSYDGPKYCNGWLYFKRISSQFNAGSHGMIDIRIKNVSERAKDLFRFVNPLTLGFSLTICALKYLTFCTRGDDWCQVTVLV